MPKLYTIKKLNEFSQPLEIKFEITPRKCNKILYSNRFTLKTPHHRYTGINNEYKKQLDNFQKLVFFLILLFFKEFRYCL